MANPKDATIDIPLATVNTRNGARRQDGNSPNDYGQQQSFPDSRNEKTAFFKRRPAGRRRKTKTNGNEKRGDDGEEDTMNQLGKIYKRILDFSIVTRYFLYVLPLAIIFAIPIIVDATATDKKELGGVRVVWFFSWIEILWLSLWVSKLVAKTLPAVFQFLCGIVSSGTRKYMLVIKNLEMPLTLVGWTLTSLSTFIPVMTHNPTQRDQQANIDKANKEKATASTTAPAASATAGFIGSLSSAFDAEGKNGTAVQHWEAVVNKILAALLVASLLLLFVKLIIQLISIGYHRKQFNAKIKDSKHNIHLLSLLYDASRTLFPAYCHEFAEEDYLINDSLELGDSGSGSGHNRSGAATPMRLLQNIGRVGDKVTSVFGNIAHEISGKQVFNPGSAHSIVVEALEKNKSAEALARRIWMSFVVEGKDALFEEDIVEVLGEGHHTEAEECFACLDRDGNGDISLDEMILTVCEFGRERHSIANSLHDVDQAINVLDGLLCTVTFVVCIFIFVAFLNSSFITTLATAGTALLSLSFVFAATAQEFLGSCIFLFVKHPYDVLDRVDIGNDQLIVEHISLLFTVFKKIDTGKLTQTANVVLNTQWIQNVSRSKAMKEQLLLWIHFDTTLEDIQLLKNEMQNFVRDKENARDFQPDVDVEVTGIHEMNKLELRVEIKHKSNWANETVRAARRSKFMCALVLALRKIPIYAPGGGEAVLGSNDKPTYTVAVSDEAAATARDTFDKKKEEKRLVPSKKDDPPQHEETRGSSTAVDTPDPRDPATPPPLRYRLAPVTEQSALSELHSRHPAADTSRDVPDLETKRSIDLSPSDASRRSTDIEEVRGMLRRQSTRGKRKASNVSSSPSNIPPPIRESSPVTSGPPPSFGSMQPTPSFPAPPSSSPPPPAAGQYQPFPPRTTSSALPPLPDQAQQQYQFSQPPQLELQHPSVRPLSPSSQLQSPTSPMTQVRSTSPGIPNPYQIHAIRSQQSAQVPAMRRPVPVPGGGNSFARDAREERERKGS